MSDRVRSYLEKVAGDYAFSPWLPLFAAAPMILGLTALEASAEAGVWGSVKVFTIATVAHAVMAGLLELARRAGGPWGRGLMGRIASAMSVYVALSQIRMGIIIGGFALWDVEDNTPSWLRLLSSASITVFGAVISSHALQTFAAYRRTRDTLLESIVESERSLIAHQNATNNLRQEALSALEGKVDGVRTRVLENLERLDAALAEGNLDHTIVARTTHDTDRVWRELSHELWLEGEPVKVRLGIAEVVAAAAQKKFVRWDLIVVGPFLILLLGFSRVFAFPEAILWSLVWGIAVGGVAGLTSWTARLSSRPDLTLMAGSLLVLSVGVLIGLIPGLGAFEVLGLVVTHLGIITIYFIVVVLTAVTQNRKAMLDALRLRLDQATLRRLAVESEFMVIAKTVAGDLHAGVRGTFLAGMMRIQKHLDDNDVDKAREELANLRPLVTGPIQTPPQGGVSGELDLFLNNWATVVELKTNFAEVAIPARVESTVTEVVKNAVNDAIRHGRATKLTITAEDQGGIFSITVENDGVVIKDDAPLGLGTATLDHLATAGWRRTVGKTGGTTLTASFTVPD